VTIFRLVKVTLSIFSPHCYVHSRRSAGISVTRAGCIIPFLVKNGSLPWGSSFVSIFLVLFLFEFAVCVSSVEVVNYFKLFSKFLLTFFLEGGGGKWLSFVPRLAYIFAGYF
jgi:hypothetical protein